MDPIESVEHKQHIDFRRKTGKPAQIQDPVKITFFALITRRSEVQILSPQPRISSIFFGR